MDASLVLKQDQARAALHIVSNTYIESIIQQVHHHYSTVILDVYGPVGAHFGGLVV
jgi:hypothetical protein